MMGSRGEIVEESATPTRVNQDTIFVAVGKDTLKWALHNSRGRKICILHVHQPAHTIPIMGTKFCASQLEEHQVRGYREAERKEMLQLLERYSAICERAGVRAAEIHIEMESVKIGIVELILQHDIRYLVMGAAADRQYYRRMVEPKSEKANYVRLQAPVTCHIWFVCKGNLIYTREGRSDGLNVGIPSPSLQAHTNSETRYSNSLRSRSVAGGQNGQHSHIG